METKDRNYYYIRLMNEYGNDLERLIKDYGIDGNSGYRKEFENKVIQDSVDDLFRMLFNINKHIPETDKNHTIEKVLLVLANYYVLDNTL
ncbi:hypothetical protein [Macrococcus armenti]|uniref:hypothetical protein n=1 Tax=Macrococcus armenti TaxID=2875764 RepID=UPI001CCD2A52|nr:hypothetical protein [Macrococcus armenti]UBH16581.1 hypothetical protein LAU44_12085 [Macrococcus armenti]UBH21216.1 hypothetical protein LAU40_12120 [Macrococcus armenti]